MNAEYHQKKLAEYAAEHAVEVKAVSDRTAANIDYNIMMGNLEDPEEESNDE